MLMSHLLVAKVAKYVLPDHTVFLRHLKYCPVTISIFELVPNTLIFNRFWVYFWRRPIWLSKERFSCELLNFGERPFISYFNQPGKINLTWSVDANELKYISKKIWRSSKSRPDQSQRRIMSHLSGQLPGTDHVEVQSYFLWRMCCYLVRQRHHMPYVQGKGTLWAYLLSSLKALLVLPAGDRGSFLAGRSN